MVVGTTTKIDINVSFPNNDITKRPTVTNSITQNTDLDAAVGAVEWSIKTDAALGVDPATVQIRGVKFYTDSEKLMEVTPQPTYFTAGAHGDTIETWVVQFNANAVASSETLYYDVLMKDDRFNFDWDPTLTIKPRPHG